MSASSSGSKTTVTLSNGVEMPVLALGSAPLSTSNDDTSHFHALNSFNGFLPEQAFRSLHAALEADPGGAESQATPVHIDTAMYYRTHPHVRQVLGNALATGRKQRSDVFLTSKVFHPNFGDAFGSEDLGHCMPLDPKCEMTYDDVYKFVYRQFQQSLNECGVGYFDLVLLHWPGRNHPETDASRNAQHRLAAWNVLEHCYSKGWARSIGVSNFSEHHLEELQSMNEAAKAKDKETNNTKNGSVAVRPHVNQIEASVFLQHSKILDYCLAHGIVAAAYSPLGRGVTHVATNTVVQDIAGKHGKDAGQVAIKYLLQKGYGCVVFWSTNPERIRSNHQLYDFDLDETEIAVLDGLNRSDGTGTWGLLSPYKIP
ncbi:unnamed protein product [Pseudo-nitzschia multistriata]|uniref:NADP-dependent oxidoreductase domain-containing protein n=1 Tax=Pseudo-nitzschia multistriata TaxID=183589 RepID=A0A448ZH68_9STRA|nr:unnamed protein product [Pseudo-nitzschia multistriata]